MLCLGGVVSVFVCVKVSVVVMSVVVVWVGRFCGMCLCVFVGIV